MAEPEDIANFIVFLCTDFARHATGATIDIPAGHSVKISAGSKLKAAAK